MVLLKGCRSPFSKGFGFWDEAFIILIHVEQTPLDDSLVTSVLFNKGINRLYSPELSSSLHKYDELIKTGWKPMSLEDLRATSGVEGFLYDGHALMKLAKKGIIAILTIGCFVMFGRLHMLHHHEKKSSKIIQF